MKGGLNRRTTEPAYALVVCCPGLAWFVVSDDSPSSQAENPRAHLGGRHGRAVLKGIAPLHQGLGSSTSQRLPLDSFHFTIDASQALIKDPQNRELYATEE